MIKQLILTALVISVAMAIFTLFPSREYMAFERKENAYKILRKIKINHNFGKLPNVYLIEGNETFTIDNEIVRYYENEMHFEKFLTHIDKNTCEILYPFDIDHFEYSEEYNFIQVHLIWNDPKIKSKTKLHHPH